MWSLFKPKKNIAPPWYKERVEELRHNSVAIAERQRLDKASLRDRLPKLRTIQDEIARPSENGQPATPPPLRATVPRPSQAQVDAKREWEVSNTHQAWRTLIDHNLICTQAESVATYDSLKKAHLAAQRAQQVAGLGTKEQLSQILGSDFSKAAGIKSGASRHAPVAIRQISDFEKHKAALLEHEIELRQNDAPQALSFVTALLQAASGIYTKADLPHSVHAATPEEEDLHRAEATQILHLAQQRIPNAEDEHARRKFIIDCVNQRYGQKFAVTLLRPPVGKSKKYTSCDQLTPEGCEKGIALLVKGARFHVMTGSKPMTNPKLTRELYRKQKTGFGRFESFITDYLPSQRGAARREAQATSNEVLARKFVSGVKPPEADINEIEAYKEWDKRTNPYRTTKNLQPADQVTIENKFLFVDPEVLQSLYLANMQENTPTLRPEECEQLSQAIAFRRLVKSIAESECGTSYDDRKIFFDKLYDDKRISDALYKDLSAINDSTQSLRWRQDAIAVFNPSNWLPPVPTLGQLATSDELVEIAEDLTLLKEELSVLAISLPPAIREERIAQFHLLHAEYARGIREGDLQRIREAYNHLRNCTSSQARQEEGAASSTATTSASRLSNHLRTIIRRDAQNTTTDLAKLPTALTNLGLKKTDVDAVMRFNLAAVQQQQDALRSTQLLPPTTRNTHRRATTTPAESRSRHDQLSAGLQTDHARATVLVDELLQALYDIVGLAQGSVPVEVTHGRSGASRQELPSLLRDALAERIERNLVVIRARQQDANGKVLFDSVDS